MPSNNDVPFCGILHVSCERRMRMVFGRVVAAVRHVDPAGTGVVSFEQFKEIFQ